MFPIAPRHSDRTPSRSPLHVVEVHRDVAPHLAAAVSDDLDGRSLVVPVNAPKTMVVGSPVSRVELLALGRVSCGQFHACHLVL